MNVTWITQAGLVFENERITVMVDPYLSNSVAEQLDPKKQRRIEVDESVFDIRPDVIDMGGREIKVLCWDWTSGSNSIFGYTGEILYKNSDEENASSVDVQKKAVIDAIETDYNCTITGDLIQVQNQSGSSEATCE